MAGKQSILDVIMVPLLIVLGIVIGGLLNSNEKASEPESFALAPCSEPVFEPEVCLMDNVQLSRIESDLFVAHQIAWDWITIEAQCTCNSPWGAFPKK